MPNTRSKTSKAQSSSQDISNLTGNEPATVADVSGSAPVQADVQGDAVDDQVDVATQAGGPDGAPPTTDITPSAMATPNVNVNNLFKAPTFTGGETRDSARALQFIDDVYVYFSVIDFFNPRDDDATAWVRRAAALRINCFPDGSYARTWFSQHASDWKSYADFKTAFTSHFVASGSDLVTMEIQYSRAKQSAEENVTQFHQRLMNIENLLGQLGRKVSEHESIARFIDGLNESVRTKIIEKRCENPDLDRQTLVSLAVTFETATHSAMAAAPHVDPMLNAVQGNRVGNALRCWYCRKTGHLAEQCRKIAARRAAGTWEDRPSTVNS